MIKAFFFDYYGVISSYDEWKTDVGREVHSDPLEAAWQDYCKRVALKREVSAQQVDEEHIRHGINRHLLAYIWQLREKYNVGLLSNQRRGQAKELMSEIGMDMCFDEIIASVDIGLYKPMPEFFEYALNQFKIEPSEAIFVDDNPQNVAGAKAVGIHGILFSGFSSMRREVEILTSLQVK